MQNYPPQGGQYGGQYGQQPPAPKKSKAPWIIGGAVGCLLLVIGIIVVASLIVYFANRDGETTTTTNSSSGTTNSSAPSSPPAGTKRYVNSREGRTGTLADNYVDFSFNYPEDWELDPDPDPSFVRVERKNDDGNTVENFSVGWFSAPGLVAGNQAVLSQAVNSLSSQVSGNFPGYTKVSEGATTFAGLSGYELRFRGAANAGQATEVPFWGRIVVLPSPSGGRNGVSIILLATGHSSEVEGLSDLGVKGELPVIVNSFKFGK